MVYGVYCKPHTVNHRCRIIKSGWFFYFLYGTYGTMGQWDNGKGGAAGWCRASGAGMVVVAGFGRLTSVLRRRRIPEFHYIYIRDMATSGENFIPCSSKLPPYRASGRHNWQQKYGKKIFVPAFRVSLCREQAMHQEIFWHKVTGALSPGLVALASEATRRICWARTPSRTYS